MQIKLILFLSFLKQDAWETTGTVTFYESPVKMSDVSFFSSRAEDALNIIRSPFDLQNLHFSDSSGDALDIDFSDGRVDNSYFFLSGNDAVDISGSTASLTNLKISRSGDKGISVGEHSEAIISSSRISGAKVGVASKDRSMVKIDDIDIVDTTFGLAAYRKKPEYGSAVIVGHSVVFDTVKHIYLLEEQSKIELDGEIQQPNHVNVAQLLAP